MKEEENLDKADKAVLPLMDNLEKFLTSFSMMRDSVGLHENHVFTLLCHDTLFCMKPTKNNETGRGLSHVQVLGIILFESLKLQVFTSSMAVSPPPTCPPPPSLLRDCSSVLYGFMEGEVCFKRNLPVF